MIVECDRCATRFRIADDRVTDRGVKVRCGRCSHVFVVRRSDMEGASSADAKLQSPDDAAATLGFAQSASVNAVSAPRGDGPATIADAPNPARSPSPARPPPSQGVRAASAPPSQSVNAAAPDPFALSSELSTPDATPDPFADIDLDADPSRSLPDPTSSSDLTARPDPTPTPAPAAAAASERFPATLSSAVPSPIAPPDPGPPQLPKGMSADIPGLFDSSDPFADLELSGSLDALSADMDADPDFEQSGSLALGSTDLSFRSDAPTPPRDPTGSLELAADPGPGRRRGAAPQRSAIGRIALKPKGVDVDAPQPNTQERHRLAMAVTGAGEAWPTWIGGALGLVLGVVLFTHWVPGTEPLRQAVEQLLGSEPLPVAAGDLELVVYPRDKAPPVPVLVGQLKSSSDLPVTGLEAVVRDAEGRALRFPLGEQLGLRALYQGKSTAQLATQARATPLSLAPGESKAFYVPLPDLPVAALGAPLEVEIRAAPPAEKTRREARKP